MASTVARGVPAGANRPCHAVASYPGSVSPMVGRFGALAARCGVLTARARTEHAHAHAHLVVMLSMARASFPQIMLFTTSAVRRNGICVILVPVASSNMTTDR